MEKLQIKIFNILPPQLEQEIEELKYICFNKKDQTPEQKKDLDDRYSGKKDRFRYIVAFIKGRPIAHIALLKRTTQLYGKHILLGGIDGVCTLSEWRKKGIASNMLSIAMEELKKEGCAIAYLCTDVEKNGRLYGRVGFKHLSIQHTYLGESGKRYYDWDGMIAPVISQDIFEEVMESKEPFDIGYGNW